MVTGQERLAVTLVQWNHRILAIGSGKRASGKSTKKAFQVRALYRMHAVSERGSTPISVVNDREGADG